VQNGMEAVTASLSFSYNNGFETIKDGGCYGYLGFSIITKKSGAMTETAGYGGPNEVTCAELPNAMPDLAKQRRAAYKKQTGTKHPN
jgi:hypothetical protein